MPKSSKHKIIVIVGANASGKSAIALKLAKKYNGEIISADSRQVYRGMDIGSGKVSKQEQRVARHYCLDVSSPKREYTISHFLKDASHAIHIITAKRKIPIVCGGTGFWIDALISGQKLPSVPPHPVLRKRLERFTTPVLYAKLKTTDPYRAETIDQKNRHRLIRALEIVLTTKKTVPKTLYNPAYTPLWIGVLVPIERYKKRVHARLISRMRKGLVSEIKRLHTQGVSYARMHRLGLEYRYVSEYVQGKMTKQEMINRLEQEILRYGKRQRTWFKRNQSIHWVSGERQASRLVQTFLRSS